LSCCNHARYGSPVLAPPPGWPAKVSDEVMSGVISLPHGWGHDLPGIHLEVAARRPGANLNALLDENLRDPLSGNAVPSGVPVRR
jgi:hypothetical protein